MDYGSRFNSDTKGLGKYDFAAIKFLYGHSLEEFASDVPVPDNLATRIRLNDYSKIPAMLGGDIENIQRRKDVSIDDSIAALRQASPTPMRSWRVAAGSFRSTGRCL